MLESMAEQLSVSADVKRVYGEPVVVGDTTIIPVARVSYGFGGGFGHSEDHEEGSGGGGGVKSEPVGVVEIRPDSTRFIHFGESRRLALAIAAGAVAGWMLGSRMR